MNFSNIKKRIIPSILVNNYHVVKSKCFEDHRIFGNLIQTVELFYMRQVDELIILDIDSSKKKNPLDNRILNLMTSKSLLPITYGGGIKTLKDIEKCLKTGCEKIILSSVLIENIEFLREAVKNFGSQSIIVNIDIIKKVDNYEIFNHVNSQLNQISLDLFIEKCHEYNCGEIVLNSVQNDGIMEGYDLEMLDYLRPKIKKPLIISGGCGSPKHMKDAINKGVDACMAGSIFFFTKYSYIDIKRFLDKNKIKIRL